MQHLLTVIDRRFGTTFLSNLIKEPSSPRKFRRKLKQTYGIIACPACCVLTSLLDDCLLHSVMFFEVVD